MLTPRMAAVPARHTQVTSGQFTFSEVLARAKRKRPAANSGTKSASTTLGCRIRGLFRSGPALWSREYDELCSGFWGPAPQRPPHCGSLEGRASVEANCHAVISGRLVTCRPHVTDLASASALHQMRLDGLSLIFRLK